MDGLPAPATVRHGFSPGPLVVKGVSWSYVSTLPAVPVCMGSGQGDTGHGRGSISNTHVSLWSGGWRSTVTAHRLVPLSPPSLAYRGRLLLPVSSRAGPPVCLCPRPFS